MFAQNKERLKTVVKISACEFSPAIPGKPSFFGRLQGRILMSGRDPQLDKRRAAKDNPFAEWERQAIGGGEQTQLTMVTLLLATGPRAIGSLHLIAFQKLHHHHHHHNYTHNYSHI